MADSNVTKRALSDALKELMQKMPFEKISVSTICERCNINRQSFYYHFKDKYDLVNWTFDTEYMAIISEGHAASAKERLELPGMLFQLLYDNRIFYSKALQIRGQNSFTEHFREVIRPQLRLRCAYIMGKDDVDDFTADFFTDAILCATERWLLEPNCMPAEQFLQRLVKLLLDCSTGIQRQLEIGNNG